jgi:hypothetical protein
MNTDLKKKVSNLHWKFIDQSTGLTCVIKLMYGAYYCGYVRIPKKFKLKKSKTYWRLEAHGGVTFSGKLKLHSGATLRGTWIGFDCIHFWDMLHPSDFKEVKKYCSILAASINEYL